MARPKAHGYKSNLERNERYPVVRWVKRHSDYKVLILEECDSSNDLKKAEQFYIGYFRSIGLSLLNLGPGGETGPVGKNPSLCGAKRSAETVARMRAASANRSPEVRAKMAAIYSTSVWKVSHRIAVEKSRSPESRALSAAYAKKADRGDAWRKKLSENHNRSPEYRAKLSAARKANPDVHRRCGLTRRYNKLQEHLKVVPRFRVNLLSETARRRRDFSRIYREESK